MVVQRIPIYTNDFGDGIQDLPVLPGNGTVSESGGALVVSVSAGQNADWWTFGRNGKLPYVLVPVVPDYTRIYYEFTIRSWTTTDSGVSALVVALFQSDTVLWFLYSQNGVNFDVYRNWNTGSLGNIATTLPRKFRFVWDPHAFTMSLQCLTTASPPTWTTVVAGQAVSMTPVGLGFGIKNYSYLPACTVQYDDTEIYAENFQVLDHDPSGGAEDLLVFPSAGPSVGGGGGSGIGVAGTGPVPEGWQYSESTFAGFEDAGKLVPAGGPPDPMSGVPDGMLVPDPQGLEDAVFLPSAGGTPDHVTGIPEGSLPSNPTDGLEDAHYAETMLPTYVQGGNDADGRSFLGDVSVSDLQAYDTAGEQWASSLGGNAFFGAGRNGKFQHDGYECGPLLNGTSFGTLLGGYNSRTWMTDVEPSAIASWVTQQTMSLVANDTVRFATTTPLTTWDWSKWLTSRLRWCLAGDFDIQVSFQNRNVSGGFDGGTPLLQCNVDDNNSFFIRMNVSFAQIWSDFQVNGSYNTGQGAAAAYSYNYGKFRLVRTGTTITRYYWDPGTSAWVQLGNTYSTSVYGLPVQMLIGCGGTGGLVITSVEVFGFTINSGTAVNTAGWAREAAGTYRGSRSDFPTRAVIAADRYAVDIIDQPNNRLWMRFVAASNNALHNSGIACRRVRMANGMLMVPYNNGGDVCVDFTTDDIRVHSAASETWTGACLRAYDGVYFGPVDRAGRDAGPAGVIASRNLGGGYAGDRDQWQTPSTTVYDADLFESGGFLYKAHATDSGIGGHKWRRWYFDGTTPANWWNPGVGKSAETSPMPWCQIAANGDLFYLSATTVYSADFATWDAHVGGSLQTWTADHSQPLPGTRDPAMGPQYRAALVGSDVFVPANEGVYRASWPGPFALQYGWEGSGAPYPILGWNPRQVFSVRAVHDSLGTPLLAIGVHWAHSRQLWSQIVLVNPATNGVYGVSPARKARTVQALAV